MIADAALRRAHLVWFPAALLLASSTAPVQAHEEPGESEDWRATPFLQAFFDRQREPTIRLTDVTIKQNASSVAGILARGDVSVRLPGLLMVTGEAQEAWLRKAAKDLASTGFVVLAVQQAQPERQTALLQETTQELRLKRLEAALHWLQSRPFVDADRIGLMGWRDAATDVLRLAARHEVQAVILRSNLRDLRPALEKPAAATLVICGGQEPGSDPAAAAALQSRLRRQSPLHAVHSFAEARPGFMMRPADSEDDLETVGLAWVAIYEFLGEHVEEAGSHDHGHDHHSGSGQQLARVIDIMRTICSTDGLRGQLARQLSAPKDEIGWETARSQAAMMAAAGNLLLEHRPPQGNPAVWRQRAKEYRAAAVQLLGHVQEQDVEAARKSIGGLSQHCAACHSDFR